MTIMRTAPLLFAALLFGCADPQAADVVEVLDAQVSAWNAGSVDGYMAGYWNSEEVTFVSGGTVPRGYEVVRDRYHHTSLAAE